MTEKTDINEEMGFFGEKEMIKILRPKEHIKKQRHYFAD